MFTQMFADVFPELQQLLSFARGAPTIVKFYASSPSAFETHAQDLRRDLHGMHPISYPEPAFEMGCTLVAWSAGVNSIILSGNQPIVKNVTP